MSIAIISLAALSLITLIAGISAYTRLSNQTRKLHEADLRLWAEASWMRFQLGSVNNQLYRLDPDRPIKAWLRDHPELPAFIRKQAD